MNTISTNYDYNDLIAKGGVNKVVVKSSGSSKSSDLTTTYFTLFSIVLEISQCHKLLYNIYIIYIIYIYLLIIYTPTRKRVNSREFMRVSARGGTPPVNKSLSTKTASGSMQTVSKPEQTIRTQTTQNQDWSFHTIRREDALKRKEMILSHSKSVG